MTRALRPTRAWAILALFLAGALSAAETPPRPPVALATGDEVLEYDWRVQGLFGAVAGLFFPSRGEGRLTRRTLEGGNVESELSITSAATEEPDYFRYGAEVSGATGATVRAWSSQLWRGKKKEKSSPIADAGVVDIASAIQRLRAEPPTAPRRMEIWSDGKLYPVEVTSTGTEKIEIGGRKMATKHIAVRPLTEPDRRVWKGELDLWLADDAAATPVRILVSRSPARVLLEIAPTRTAAK